MMCKVRNPSRRGGWRSRGRGAVGRRAAVRGFQDALDQVVSKEAKWFLGCLVCAAWWALALVFCRSAYASPQVEVTNWAGYENNEDYWGYVVVDCPNEYIAALTLIGEYTSLPQIDSDMYAKLSNESTGGRFYQIVQLWEKIGRTPSGEVINYPVWAGSMYFQEGLVDVYGYGRVWEAVMPNSLKNGAKQDFLTILGGGSIGDSGGELDEDGWLIPADSLPNEITMIYTNFEPWSYPNEFGTNEITGIVSQVNGTINSGRRVVIGYFDNRNHTQRRITVFYCPENIVYKVNSTNGIIFKNKSSNSTSILFYMQYNVTADTTNKTITFNVNEPNAGAQTLSANGTYSTGQLFVWPNVEHGTGGGAGGENNWPDDDTPQPPSPNPPTPTTPDPDPGPTLPPIDPHDPVIPSPPTNEPAPTGTTPTDYTPWLSAILQQLVNLTSYLETCFTWLGTALDDHCQHIRDHMTTCFNWLGDYVITGMSNLLGEHHTFLNGLAQWIVDNIKWENSGGEFDDSNMIYWLRRIYARQGSGDVNSRPVDPATDYSGFAGWLGVLYDAVALDVSDTSLTALSSSLSGLQHTFPFSLPWDVKQVLQALDVSPVTPSASIPSGTSGVSYNVDLHWMDSAMVSVRAFELLVFIVYVMVHTKDLFGYLMGE